jgi:hypothetical protein
MEEKKISKYKEKKLQKKREFREYIKLSCDDILDISKTNIELVAEDEIFFKVDYAEHYWISNHGRLVNNNRKDGSFRFHKISSDNNARGVHWTIVSYDIDGSPVHTEIPKPEELVAQYFLVKPKECNKVWHIDGNKNNNYYRNLIYVTDEEYDLLHKKVMKVDDLKREQEYYNYNTVNGNPAYHIWNGIYARCYGGKRFSKFNVNLCYDGSTMCDSWRYDKDAFAEWYSSNYYECYGETMMVDKDLLCRGNKEYAPDKCCLLPQPINSALASATKKRILKKKSSKKNKVPECAVGVSYDEYKKKFFARIQPFKHDRMETLHYWDTNEEAFQEYKLFKESEIRILAVRYRSVLPEHIFDALIKYEVFPYSPYEEREDD